MSTSNFDALKKALADAGYKDVDHKTVKLPNHTAEIVKGKLQAKAIEIIREDIYLRPAGLVVEGSSKFRAEQALKAAGAVVDDIRVYGDMLMLRGITFAK